MLFVKNLLNFNVRFCGIPWGAAGKSTVTLSNLERSQLRKMGAQVPYCSYWETHCFL